MESDLPSDVPGPPAGSKWLSEEMESGLLIVRDAPRLDKRERRARRIKNHDAKKKQTKTRRRMKHGR